MMKRMFALAVMVSGLALAGFMSVSADEPQKQTNPVKGDVTGIAAAKADAKGCCAKGCCQATPATQVVQGKVEAPKADAKSTVVTVAGMSCAGCAKKVSEAVAKVEGVESASVDLAAKAVKYTPKADKKVSPKEVWEVIEKAGYTPAKLEGPDGVFEKKPAA